MSGHEEQFSGRVSGMKNYAATVSAHGNPVRPRERPLEAQVSETAAVSRSKEM
jgi:hypothetical protein